MQDWAAAVLRHFLLRGKKKWNEADDEGPPEERGKSGKCHTSDFFCIFASPIVADGRCAAKADFTFINMIMSDMTWQC